MIVDLRLELQKNVCVFRTQSHAKTMYEHKIVLKGVNTRLTGR